PDGCERAGAAVAAAPDVDAGVFVLSNVLGRASVHPARAVAAVAQRIDKPISLTWLAARDETAEARAILAEAGVVVHGSVGGPIPQCGGGVGHTGWRCAASPTRYVRAAVTR